LAILGWSGFRLVTDRPVFPFGGEEGPSADAPAQETSATIEAAVQPPAQDPASNPAAEAAQPSPAQAGDAQAGDAPAGEVAVRKVLENVMALWVDALVNDDFAMFHSALSRAWRQQDSPALLNEAYGVLASHKDSLGLFPSRGKLVLLESRPYQEAAAANSEEVAPIRDTLGPESPWLVRGEWRFNKTALGFTLVLTFEEGQWRPLSLRVEIYA
jgi:hypothetical protein